MSRLALLRLAVPALLAGALLASCSGSGGDTQEPAPTPAPADTTPPVVGSVAAAPAQTSATITWTTNEPADSQVEYGPTAAYGSTTARDTTLRTAHSVTVNGLSPGTLYHFRVRSRDGAGNATTGSDATFTTAAPSDTTPPVVAISAPASGATVSGTVTIAANATDNVGVVGVQFRLDGVALGGEDLTAPYSFAWNTTGASNGVHSLTAVARDAAGNQTTSAAVSVTVGNAPPPSGAAIAVGQIEVDPPTLETIGIALPITSGDTNHNARVLVSYRRQGDTEWKEALPLFRVRPETLSDEEPPPFSVPRQFAGSIFGLQPDTAYEVMLDVQDPDGGSTTRTATIRTRAEPPAAPATPRTVNVSTSSQLSSALSAAQPGDVIVLADGTYNGAFGISRSGNASNPIFIRGASRDGAIINASGSTYGLSVSGSFVTVENLTIRNSTWGMRLSGAQHAVVRRVRIHGVSYGIDARGGSKRDFTICDNVLEGVEAVWPDNREALWGFEGIVVTGQGHVVCHNRVSGFGDALGLHGDSAIPNRAIDFYGNDVLWAGDNGIELDQGQRNVRAFRNRITNAGTMAMSFQPVWGGPAYSFRNIFFNSGNSPYKWNNEPSGIVIFHNTAIRPGVAWSQYGRRADNILMQNNLTIGTSSQVVDMSTVLSLARIDYNGWLPDGSFRIGGTTWNSFATLQANSPYESNGRLLNGLPFEPAVTIPSSYTTFMQPIDATLRAGSNAVDAGIRLPNINDGFSGGGPDLGALELGQTPPRYGPR